MAKNKSKGTPSTPSKEKLEKKNNNGSNKVAQEEMMNKSVPFSPQKKQQTGRQSSSCGRFVRTTISAVVIPLVVVTMCVIALSNVNYLVHGNNATARWMHGELERGLKEPLLDRTLQLQDVAQLATTVTTSIHDLLTKNGVDESYLTMLKKVPTLVPKGEIPVHVKVFTKDIPFIAILTAFVMVLSSSIFRLLCAIISTRGKLNNVNPRKMYKKLSEMGGITARAQAAHENATEALLYLTSAVMVTFVGTSSVDHVLLAKLCIIYIAARLVYHIVYALAGLTVLGGLRSLVFFHGVAALLFIFVMPIQHVLSNPVVTSTASATGAL